MKNTSTIASVRSVGRVIREPPARLTDRSQTGLQRHHLCALSTPDSWTFTGCDSESEWGNQNLTQPSESWYGWFAKWRADWYAVDSEAVTEQHDCNLNRLQRMNGSTGASDSAPDKQSCCPLGRAGPAPLLSQPASDSQSLGPQCSGNISKSGK